MSFTALKALPDLAIASGSDSAASGASARTWTSLRHRRLDLQLSGDLGQSLKCSRCKVAAQLFSLKAGTCLNRYYAAALEGQAGGASGQLARHCVNIEVTIEVYGWASGQQYADLPLPSIDPAGLLQSVWRECDGRSWVREGPAEGLAMPSL